MKRKHCYNVSFYCLNKAYPPAHGDANLCFTLYRVMRTLTLSALIINVNVGNNYLFFYSLVWKIILAKFNKFSDHIIVHMINQALLIEKRKSPHCINCTSNNKTTYNFLELNELIL